jgi:acetyl esterase
LVSPHVVLGVFAVLFEFQSGRSTREHVVQPSVRTYKAVGGTELKAHIFVPEAAVAGKLRAAIVLLHGGGWTAGSPEWMYGDAQRYAGLGMVAIAGEYRLSDQKNITPLEAMGDVRDLMRWVRQNAADLAIDPQRIAIYGVSAGGHRQRRLQFFLMRKKAKPARRRMHWF